MKSNYHHGDLKSELIQKGLVILNNEGYDGLSLRKVAKACQVSQTAPYRHFKDKDALIAAITQETMSAFGKALSAAAQSTDEPKMQLKRIGVAYVRFFAQNPEYMRLLFFSDAKRPVKNACEKTDHLHPGHPFAVLYQTVERYKAAYADEQRSVNELVLYCWGLVHGICVLQASKQLPFEKDCDELSQMVIMSEKFL